MSRATPSAREEFTDILEAIQRLSDDAAATPARMSDQQLKEILDGIPELGDHTYIPSQVLGKIYAEARSQRAPEPEAPKPEPEIAADERPEHEIVADELGLSPGLSVDDLNRVRREYALANHPDRVAAPLREQATRRMTIANTVIDQAIRARKAQVAARS